MNNCNFEKNTCIMVNGINCRMRDDAVVHTDFTNDQSTFSITRASTNDTGYYTCRASNDYSAIISSSATVHIRGKLTLISCYPLFTVVSYS